MQISSDMKRGMCPGFYSIREKVGCPMRHERCFLNSRPFHINREPELLLFKDQWMVVPSGGIQINCHQTRRQPQLCTTFYVRIIHNVVGCANSRWDVFLFPISVPCAKYPLGISFKFHSSPPPLLTSTSRPPRRPPQRVNNNAINLMCNLTTTNKTEVT